MPHRKEINIYTSTLYDGALRLAKAYEAKHPDVQVTLQTNYGE